MKIWTLLFIVFIIALAIVEILHIDDLVQYGLAMCLSCSSIVCVTTRIKNEDASNER